MTFGFKERDDGSRQITIEKEGSQKIFKKRQRKS